MTTATMSGVQLDDALARVLASDPVAMANPFPVWDALREQSPIRRMGPVVLITRHADVRAVIRDEHGLSNGTVISGTRMERLTASLNEQQLRAYREVASFESLYVSRSDGEQHARLRRIAHRAFTPRRIALMRKSVEHYTSQLLDAIDAEAPTDLMSALAYRLPMMVISDMLEVPEEDREQIHTWTNELGRNRGGDDPEALMVAHRAMRDFRHYVEEILVPERRAGEGTDLVTALMQAREGDQLTPTELTAMFVILLFAGHETTTNLIGNGMLELMRHRDQWDRLCADPSIAPQATEELLRWVSPVQWLGRVALEDIEIGKERIRRGETVFPVLAAANRDPDVFDDPQQLDLTRGDARHHLSLGFGPHFCLGNAVARMEGAVVFGTLARRHPEFELLDDAPRWRGNAMLRGLESLQVKLGPRCSESRNGSA